MSFPPPAFPPAAPPARGASSTATRLLVALLLVGITAGYLLFVFLSRGIWADRDATRVTFTAQTQDGAPPTPEAMTQAVQVIKARLGGIGISGAVATADVDTVAVTVPSRDLNTDAVRGLLRSGQLHVRPVIHAMAAKTPTTPVAPGSRPVPRAEQAQRIADEKELRQSSNPSIQILALQYQATRCADDDALAGHDDPQLPLVTCSADGKTVYVLDKSVLSGADIRRATSDFDRESGWYVVDAQFTDGATGTWADFTAANIGTQTAFTVDTRVLSAPETLEPIPDGHTKISGEFTADSARRMAGVLTSGSLPVTLTYQSATDETLPATMLSMLLRGAVIVSGLGLALLLVGALVYLLRRGRSKPVEAWPPTPRW
ncbi:MULTISPECIES: SecDF P1 head subdomain-containing protein [unclassified Mycolicibacterium]|uniref:SecDF P1 head subdomain-containing protein n=1 Tax=unclassified Mycolicibacterium TaxID=2636767 RepID=UPI0012DC06BC|nr:MULTISPECIES: hypothetical protein [unclassified Mycolicibacterium]MUL84353.1 hypothetical protein [Mycolicibacterium sp. CBMA 329]MUL88128.1 hypothetical protein [Mycolicibacterium sp. CBMA 331]MUM02483.1 hypothetical protein [Mycolicibacterium sp. CBMA 334]MUM26025.1 hypothetical protein [Mycolicibacterium sp. CBMA 295]MUM39775.1 hypothetical protein [Mycolicibacterium sp. CBMA 247]